MTSKVDNLKGHRFKKGQVLGHNDKYSPVRRVRTLTKKDVAEIGTLVLAKNFTRLKEIADDARYNPDSKHSGLKAWIATVVMRGIAKGDAHALDVLLNRLIGKVTDEISLTQNMEAKPQVVLTLPLNSSESDE